MRRGNVKRESVLADKVKVMVKHERKENVIAENARIINMIAEIVRAEHVRTERTRFEKRD